MFYQHHTLILSSLLAALVVYLSLLSRHLQTRHPEANPRPPPSAAEYTDADSYHEIDMLNSMPRSPTHTGYAIIGGSGFLGTYLIRLLLLRGETNIRVLDLSPPPDEILSHSSVSFIRTDITSLPSLRSGLSESFPTTKKPPAVVYHMAAIIRFWERASYTWPVSYKINVQGTENVLAAVQDVVSVRSLIYTSTADVAIPRPNTWALGLYYLSRYPWKTVIRSDGDVPLTEAVMSESCYTLSKKMAEDLIKAANGTRNGALKTGILRPGYTIVGVNDRLISSTLNMPRVPIFDKTFSQTSVNAWDVAAAHLLLEEALRKNPEEVAGQAFLVSGPREAWTLEDIRNAIKHYSTRPLVYQEVPPVLIYILAHTLELFLYVRWHTLAPIYAILGKETLPSLFPRWLGEAVYLQPATLEYLADVDIDDSRARGVLGYMPQWHMLQTIKNVVDEFESGSAGTKHGMQLRHVPEIET
ncbi:NAD(P)-binding protein [Ramaria rubella]|nr:NAD(P)-binding protein [Ramaria rubella]